MTTPEKWAAGTLPKRGAVAKRKSSSSTPGGRLAQRVARLQHRALVGRPLATALGARIGGPATKRSPMSAWGAVAMTLGLAGGVFGLVLGRPFVLLSGAMLGCLGGLLFWRGSRNGQNGDNFFSSVGAEAALLDGYLDDVSPELPQPVASALAELKKSLVDVVEGMGDAGRAGAIPVDEQFFVHELMGRYVRDACDGYLAVLRATRGIPLSDEGRSAEASLLAQIDVLHGRLKNILAMVASAEVEKLARHQAFIETKR